MWPSSSGKPSLGPWKPLPQPSLWTLLQHRRVEGARNVRLRMPRREEYGLEGTRGRIHPNVFGGWGGGWVYNGISATIRVESSGLLRTRDGVLRIKGREVAESEGSSEPAGQGQTWFQRLKWPQEKAGKLKWHPLWKGVEIQHANKRINQNSALRLMQLRSPGSQEQVRPWCTGFTDKTVPRSPTSYMWEKEGEGKIHTFLHFKNIGRDFPGGPVVKTSPSNAGGAGSIPGRGTEIPHASGPKHQKHKTETIL